MSNSTSLPPSPFAVLLMDYGISNYYYYIHPVLAYFTSFQNLLCTIVLASRELRSSGPFFKYSLINSAGAVLAFFLLSFLFLTKCGGSVCSISPTYWSQAYTIYAIYYVAYVYYITSALIQIASGVQIYLSIRQQLKWLSSISPYKVCLTFFCISALVSVVNLFLYTTDPFPIISLNSNGTRIVQYFYYSHLINNQALVVTATVWIVITNYVFLVILIILNILIYMELKKIMAKKRLMTVGDGNNTLKSESESAKTKHSKRNNVDGSLELNSISQSVHTSTHYKKAKERSSVRRSLIMTLWISVIFSSDRFMKCVYRTMVLINPFWQATIYLNAVSYIFDMIVYSSFFFVYMHTNKMFKKKFYQIVFRRRF